MTYKKNLHENYLYKKKETSNARKRRKKKEVENKCENDKSFAVHCLELRKNERSTFSFKRKGCSWLKLKKKKAEEKEQSSCRTCSNVERTSSSSKNTFTAFLYYP